MADLVLAAMERIFRVGLKIKEALKTVQQNKKECRDMGRCLAAVTPVLDRLKQSATMLGAVMPQAISAPALDLLADSMEDALKLIEDCQQRSALRHLLGAGDMAKQLRQVQDDIQFKLSMASLVTSTLNLEISILVTNTRHYLGAHPPLQLPQVAGELNSYDSILRANEMRSGVNSNTTMVARGNAVPYASSSKFTEFVWSEGESTFNLASVEQISEGGHGFVLKRQKIVIKVAMSCDKSRSKVMALVAAAGGVDSAAIDGVYRDKVVLGHDMDACKLITTLRRKMGCADLLMISPYGPSCSGELPARQRFSDPSSGSSSDPDSEEEEEEEEEDVVEEQEESPRTSSFKAKAKQSLQVTRPNGSSPKWLGHLLSSFCLANHE